MAEPRFCGLSATLASRVFSIIAVLMIAWPGINAWWFKQWIGINIIMDAMVIVHMILACIVFMACSQKAPSLMYIVILVQFFTILLIIGDVGTNLYYLWYTVGGFLDAYYSVELLMTVTLSIVALASHISCQQFLFFESITRTQQLQIGQVAPPPPPQQQNFSTAPPQQHLQPTSQLQNNETMPPYFNNQPPSQYQTNQPIRQQQNYPPARPQQQHQSAPQEQSWM